MKGQSVMWFWALLLIMLSKGDNSPSLHNKMNIRQNSWRVWNPNGTNDYGKNDWILIQHRKGNQVDAFDKKWADYVNGFGNPEGNAYWLGLKIMHQATRIGKWELLLSIRYEANSRGIDHVIFTGFKVESEVFEYTLRVNGIGSKDQNNDLYEDGLLYFNNQPFSAEDRDNDASTDNCANAQRGGWWFNACFLYCLNCKNVDGYQITIKVVETFMGMRKIKEN